MMQGCHGLGLGHRAKQNPFAGFAEDGDVIGRADDPVAVCVLLYGAAEFQVVHVCCSIW